YLYIFTTEDDTKATMIFPDGRLNGGKNKVLAHVPYEVPSSLEEREDYRWFKFDKQPAVERLYLVFARRLLPEGKTGEDLAAYCRSQVKKDCAWAPPGTFWDQIIADAKTPKFHSTKRSEGQVLSDSEREASSRHIGLSQGDPEPWLVVTNPDAGSHSLTM